MARRATTRRSTARWSNSRASATWSRRRSSIRPISTTAQFLQRQGYEVTFLPVESDGSLDIHLLEKSIRPDTAIVSVMWANNETGVIFPVEEVAALCRSKGVLCHSDAVQAPGKLKIDVKSAGVDFLSLSAHKLYAPKGIGLLYVKRRTPFQPYVIGGHQERGRRGGTENVPHIIGFGRAAELAMDRGFDRVQTRQEAARPDGARDSRDDPEHVCEWGPREPASNTSKHRL